MLSLEQEIVSLRPRLGDAAADALIARERREVFSLYPELRILGWGGASLIAAAAGILLKNHLDDLGPVVLAILLGLAAAACYAWAWWRRARATIVDDYVLLLGALLLSADVGFVESQFHLLGNVWPRHFLLLAVIHGVTAYLFGSRLVLSLSIAALAAWLGVERGRVEQLDIQPPEFALRGWACALLLLAWRFVDRRFLREGRPDFAPLFEHFAANLAFWGSLALVPESDTRPFGCLIAMALAAFVIWWGFHRKTESFVLYAFVYGVIAADILLLDLLGSQQEGMAMLLIILSMIGAVVGLFSLHASFRKVQR